MSIKLPHLHLTGICLVIVLALTACDGREESYRQAVDDLAEANEQREAARKDLDAKTNELAATKAQLQQAMEEVAEAREEVESATQEVISSADDIVLFRVLQGKLLEDETLEGTAIGVMVRDQVAILRGRATERQSAYAEQLVVSQPGIASVRNHIVTGPLPSEEEQSENSGSG